MPEGGKVEYILNSEFAFLFSSNISTSLDDYFLNSARAVSVPRIPSNNSPLAAAFIRQKTISKCVVEMLAAVLVHPAQELIATPWLYAVG